MDMLQLLVEHEEWVYAGMFLNALVAATFFPAASEAVLAGLVYKEIGSPLWLFGVATTGNVLGSIVNWYLGRGISHLRHKKWFPLKEKQYQKAHDMFERYGEWSLLFSWVPFIGDPLTIVAGALQIPFKPFIILVTIGKAIRYAVVIAGGLWFT
jgi:membrane protein YqaA with SNARE-associated domain